MTNIIKNSQYSSPSFDNFYNKISPEVQKTFTHEQIQAIKIACESNNSYRRHPLDIRVSVPIPGLRFYLVLLAGKERRSKQRLQYERSIYPWYNPVNVLFIFLLLAIFSTSSFSIFQFFFSSTTSKSTESHPTSIPWIDNELQCQHTKRVWQDDKCWDAEHSPTF